MEISGDVSKLRDIGFNDRVSSIQELGPGGQGGGGWGGSGGVGGRGVVARGGRSATTGFASPSTATAATTV